MKTRQEMIYDFMLALAPTFEKISDDLISTSPDKTVDYEHVAFIILGNAASLADAYLGGLS